MKLILTGANGFIGLEVISRALSHPSITSLITITRKPLPAPYNTTNNPKLHPIIVKDFSSYPSFILSQLSGADACIWMLGSKSQDLELGRKLRMEYPMTAARVFTDLAKAEGKKFRFVFGSGIFAVRDQKSTLLIYPEIRKLGGQAELDMLAFGEENVNDFETFVVRPAAVLTKERSRINSVLDSLPYSIRVDELAAVLIDLAENGAKKTIFENADLRQRGKKLIGKAGN